MAKKASTKARQKASGGDRKSEKAKSVVEISTQPVSGNDHGKTAPGKQKVTLPANLPGVKAGKEHGRGKEKVVEKLPQPITPARGRPARQPAEGLRGQFGARIKALREAKGMTGRDLARESGLATTTVYDCEAGRFGPTLDGLSALAKALGTTMAKLVEGLDE